MSSAERERKYWGFMLPIQAHGTTALAKQAGDQGLHGLFAAQVWGPPFVPPGHRRRGYAADPTSEWDRHRGRE